MQLMNGEVAHLLGLAKTISLEAKNIPINTINIQIYSTLLK